jgi:hypothetical protein
MESGLMNLPEFSVFTSLLSLCRLRSRAGQASLPGLIHVELHGRRRSVGILLEDFVDYRVVLVESAPESVGIAFRERGIE